jgi:hypothetical protein
MYPALFAALYGKKQRMSTLAVLRTNAGEEHIMLNHHGHFFGKISLS